jgi:hypothetical protein
MDVAWVPRGAIFNMRRHYGGGERELKYLISFTNLVEECYQQCMSHLHECEELGWIECY